MELPKHDDPEFFTRAIRLTHMRRFRILDGRPHYGERLRVKQTTSSHSSLTDSRQLMGTAVPKCLRGERHPHEFFTGLHDRVRLKTGLMPAFVSRITAGKLTVIHSSI
jgi:hypothetical protein